MLHNGATEKVDTDQITKLFNASAMKKNQISRFQDRLAVKVEQDGKRLIVGGFATPGGPVLKAISLLTFFGVLQRK
ncbi:MAG: hypothetical protein J7K75_06510 [Desulfuromonas sp.]|nr:hypothetical protein [Desulfuromonas sp.]